MGHQAEIVDGVVVRVIVAEDTQWCIDTYGGQWIQTSYNTQGGQHLLGGTPLRKNYAGEGYTYDSVRDAFIPPKCHEVAVLDEDTCLWTCTDPTHVIIEGEI